MEECWELLGKPHRQLADANKVLLFLITKLPPSLSFFNQLYAGLFLGYLDNQFI